MPVLNERVVRDLKPLGGKQRIVWDKRVPGFGVRVSKAGAKAYVCRYTSPADGRRHLSVICRIGEATLKQARERASETLRAVREGSAGPVERAQAMRAAPDVAEVVERFLSELCAERVAAGRMKPSTRHQYRTQCARYIVPVIGEVKVAGVDRAAVERVASPLPGVTRNRVLGTLSQVMDYAERLELRPDNSNPTRHVIRHRERVRERVLAPSEIEAFTAALASAEDRVCAAVFTFLMLTGWRVSEALALRQDQIDMATGLVTLPDTKVGSQRRVLHESVRELLRTVPGRIRGPYAFPGSRDGRPVGYNRVRLAFHDLCETAGIPDAKIHDIRRSVATFMAADGASLTAIRDLLGHSRIDMAARYSRRSEASLRAATDAAAARMGALMGK